MPLYRLGDLSPKLAAYAWAAPSADLIGDVRLGERASVWFGAVIRAVIERFVAQPADIQHDADLHRVV